MTSGFGGNENAATWQHDFVELRVNGIGGDSDDGFKVNPTIAGLGVKDVFHKKRLGETQQGRSLLRLSPERR